MSRFRSRSPPSKAGRRQGAFLFPRNHAISRATGAQAGCGRAAWSATSLSSEENKMKFCVVGNGAMGVAHLKALANVPGMEVTALQSRTAEGTEKTAKEYKVPFFTTDFTQ